MAGTSAFRLIDLFSGAGGMTRGFVEEDFVPVMAVESDLQAAATYAANFGEDHILCGPIESFIEVPEADVVIGGPPCQGFSNLGKRDLDDTRNRLYMQFLDVVAAAHAKVFVFENVARFRQTPQCDDLLELAEDLGFRCSAFTLNAALFGVPQRRTRTIIIGSRLGQVGDPVETHGKPQDPDTGKPAWRTVRDAIAQLPPTPPTVELPARWSYYFGERVRGAFALQDIHVGRTYRPVSLQRYDLIAPGRNRFDLPDELLFECWRKHKSGSGDVMGRLEWDKPSVTIRTEFFKPEKGRYLHPQWEQRGRRQNRALTHAEAALLQGFDERHVWCGTKVEIARQIGNAVPPPLARAAARVVRQELQATTRHSIAA